MTSIPKTVETLIEDIDAVLLSGQSEPDEKVLESFGKSVASSLSTSLKKWAAPETPTLRMSNLGRNTKQLWYEMNGYKGEGFDATTRLKFLYGDITEHLLLTLAELSGHKVENKQLEVELDGIKGHIDCTIDGEVVDVKSSASFSYEKFEDGTLFDNDGFGYITQVSAYAEALGKDKAYFVALDKQYGYTCLLRVPRERFKDVRKRVAELKDIVKCDKPPEVACAIRKEDNGNEYLGFPCNYCQFKKECHPNLRTFQYATGPRHFTKVLKEPRVLEVK